MREAHPRRYPTDLPEAEWVTLEPLLLKARRLFPCVERTMGWISRLDPLPKGVRSIES